MGRSISSLLLALGALTAAPAPARAETGDPRQAGDAAPPVRVETLVAEALAASPALAAAAAQAAAAREEALPAGALPDPMLEVMLQNAGFPQSTVGRAEMSMAGIELRQELAWPGKRPARRAAAAAAAAARGEELAALRRRLIAEVRVLAAALHAVERERAVLDDARELLELLAATTAARYAAGEAGQGDVVRRQLEVAQLQSRRLDLDAERTGLAARLNALRDRPQDQPLGPVAALPEIAAPAADWEALAAAAAPAVAVRRAEAAVAARRRDLARAESRPDAFAGAGYGYRGDFDPLVTLRLGVTLPLRRGQRQLPALRAAEHELAAAQSAQRDAEAAARAEAARLAARWQRDQAQLSLYREAILPRSSAAFDASRSAYLAGRGEFATVIDDLAAWLEARVQLARREADRYATWARIAELAGGSPDMPAGGAQEGQEP